MNSNNKLKAWLLCCFKGAASSLLIAGFVTQPAHGQAAATTATPQVFKIGIGTTETGVQAQSVRFFGEQLEKYTQGAYKIELHAGGTLGNDLTMTKALQEGTLAMTAPDSSTLASLEKSFSVINYPFTFINESEADAVLDGPWGTRLLSSLPQHGLIGLAFWENGFRQMTNSRKPVSSLLDFAGLRMRTMQKPHVGGQLQAVGF
ncbi:MAG: TRAP transporter substrate-binding protein DctP [Rhodoferax sp.]|nr:TRAP transporter substrate-binding protein DctP [Rhodoferax sp.]